MGNKTISILKRFCVTAKTTRKTWKFPQATAKSQMQFFCKPLVTLMKEKAF